LADIDGVGFTLPCNVRSVEGNMMHLAFELDPAAAAELPSIVERLALRRAA
jgi:hypothetical protein